MARKGTFRLFDDPEELDRILQEELRHLGDDAELVFAAHARKRTGRMARNIKAHANGRTIEVTVFAADPKTGFDYVAVTRFGHKVARIYPRTRARATVVATGRARGRGRSAALRFVAPDGRVLYRKSVKGFRPTYDWAERAFPEVQRSADRAMQRIGRRINLG